MGDGSALAQGLKICTDSYSIKDVVRLMNVLIIKYRLECRLRTHRKNQYRIYIRQSSMHLLQDIVAAHMHSSMLYKLGLKKKTRILQKKIQRVITKMCPTIWKMTDLPSECNEINTNNSKKRNFSF